MTKEWPHARTGGKWASGHGHRWASSALLVFGLAATALGNGGFLQIRNGYFWDPVKAEYFIPRGMAYQTFNPPVGANQTFEQLEYDLREFKKIYANSVRAEMVWNEVERSQGVFDWSRPDFLVAKAEELGLKLFVLIGFQYAPGWFPEDWKAINNVGSNSVVLAYEHPQARTAYSNFIYQVTSRYRNSTTIVAWILGNEYAYFDLWEQERYYLGYDSFSVSRFRQYLSNLYSNNIAALNTNWETTHTSFNTIPMPTAYPANRHLPGFHDLIQWRKASIGEYVAVGAVAAKAADPNHLRTYSMVGGLFGEADIHNTCEDAKTIVATCAAAGAPLDFWSINNYGTAGLKQELRSADFGIAKHQAASGLPVMISETGHSSTENLAEGAAERQAAALPTQMWEALMSGAIGTHIFTWNDRDRFYGDNFPREKGFGIVHQSRLIKSPVYWNVMEMFRRMEQLNIDGLLGGSTNPAPDMQFFWSQHTDMGWPRANHENIRLWSALQRLGYQPGIIDDEQFERGDYRNARALVLSRCYQMHPQHLEMVATNVMTAGIHVHASTDLPGEYTAYHQRNPRWVIRMSDLFGLNSAGATPGWDAGSVGPEDRFRVLQFEGVNSLGTITPAYRDVIGTWKIWHGVSANSGATIVTHRGVTGAGNIPALHIKTNGSARTAINTFALGELDPDAAAAFYTWDFRYKWLQAIYGNHFGMAPAIALTGTGAQYVFPDYRALRNGSVLISLLNGHTNSAVITLTASTLLSGRMVENLTSGGIVEANSDGVLNLSLAGDQYVLLYAYNPSSPGTASLLNTNRNKLWFESAPTAVWPDGNDATVTVGYDSVDSGLELVVALERELLPPKSYGESARIPISGSGSVSVQLPVPDADLNDIDHLSSMGGGSYQWHAWIEQGGRRISEVTLPIQLFWGVRPDSLPGSIVPGSTYAITLRWEDLPSYEASEHPSPLSRADRWEPLKAKRQFYNVILELRNAGGTIATDAFLTSTGTDSHIFSIRVPTNAAGPFNWFASLRPVHNVSHDVFDSFEDRVTGATNSLTAPWRSYVYSEFSNAQWFAEGVYTNSASEGAQGAFIIVTNPPASGSFAGFGFYYPFPTSWALPVNVSDWANYTFACDIKEETGLSCAIELQLKDVRGGTLTLTRPYSPGANGWDTISGSLDQFVVSSVRGYFDPSQVHDLFVNVQMRQSNAIYFVTIDNVRFDGPDQIPTLPSPIDVHDSFEDRDGGANPLLVKPWDAYPYSEVPTSDMVWAVGVGDESTHGGQSAFMLVTNPPTVGAYSGFLLIRPFAQVWGLPDMAGRSNYVFSWDFKETSGRSCILELQIKDTSGGLLHYTNQYIPDASGWHRITARLDQFRKPSFVPSFDPANVKELLVIVQMLQKSAVYFGFFDNIQFFGPRGSAPLEPIRALYRSDNDSGADSDDDGIPDIYETGTGIFVSPTNTGTHALRRDTDGDGADDRAELTAGTNPNSVSDVLRFTDIARVGGQPRLSWMGRSNRVYAVQFVDGNLHAGGQFCPVETLGSITTPTNGLLQVFDPTGSGLPLRIYRLRAHQP